MTAALHHIPSSSAYTVPPTQNTAPVHEFRCLYTHDIRRKAKRWQDGFLRFHTFNKRVMVYDDQRNFIGDMHWQEGSDDPQEGDEVSLERGSALVQIGEQNGSVEQDLSGIIGKRVAKPIEREPGVVRTGTQLHTRSPNVVRQSPQRLGRAAVPLDTPFEIRHRTAGVENWEQGPSTKRQRRDDNHIPLWELLKTSKPSRPGGAAMTATSVRAVVPNVTARPEIQSRLKVRTTIDLTSSVEKQVEKPANPMPRIPTKATKDSNNHNASVVTRPKALERLRVTPAVRQEQSKRLENKPSDAPMRPERNVGFGPTSSSPLRPPSRQKSRTTSIEPRDETTTSPKARPAISLDIPATNSSSRNTKTKPARPKDVSRKKHLHPDTTPNRTRSLSPAVSTTSHLPKPVEEDNEIYKTIDCAIPTVTKQKNTMKPLRLSSRAPKKTLLCQTLIPPGALDSPLQKIHVPEHIQLNKQQSKRASEHRNSPSPSHLEPPSSPSTIRPSSPEQPPDLPAKQAEASPVQRDGMLRKTRNERSKRMPFSDNSDSEPAFETSFQPVKAITSKAGDLIPENFPKLDVQSPKIPELLAAPNEPVGAVEPDQGTKTAAVFELTNDESPIVETTADLPPVEDADLGVKQITRPVISAMRGALQRATRETNGESSFRPPTRLLSNPSITREGSTSNPGPDYSHLDAQLLTRPNGVGSAEEEQSTKALEPERPLDAAIQAPHRPKPANPQFKALSISKPKKPLARSHSINTSNEAVNGGPARRLNTGLQRAETLPNNGPSGYGLPSPEVVDEDVTAHSFNTSQGAWSREAWDLLGWAPPDRQVIMSEG